MCTVACIEKYINKYVEILKYQGPLQRNGGEWNSLAALTAEVSVNIIHFVLSRESVC